MRYPAPDGVAGGHSALRAPYGARFRARDIFVNEMAEVIDFDRRPAGRKRDRGPEGARSEAEDQRRGLTRGGGSAKPKTLSPLHAIFTA